MKRNSLKNKNRQSDSQKVGMVDYVLSDGDFVANPNMTETERAEKWIAFSDYLNDFINKPGQTRAAVKTVKGWQDSLGHFIRKGRGLAKKFPSNDQFKQLPEFDRKLVLMARDIDRRIKSGQTINLDKGESLGSENEAGGYNEGDFGSFAQSGSDEAKFFPCFDFGVQMNDCGAEDTLSGKSLPVFDFEDRSSFDDVKIDNDCLIDSEVEHQSEVNDGEAALFNTFNLTLEKDGIELVDCQEGAQNAFVDDEDKKSLQNLTNAFNQGFSVLEEQNQADVEKIIEGYKVSNAKILFIISMEIADIWHEATRKAKEIIEYHCKKYFKIEKREDHKYCESDSSDITNPDIYQLNIYDFSSDNDSDEKISLISSLLY